MICLFVYVYMHACMQVYSCRYACIEVCIYMITRVVVIILVWYVYVFSLVNVFLIYGVGSCLSI